jgi:hypothetical protein
VGVPFEQQDDDAEDAQNLVERALTGTRRLLRDPVKLAALLVVVLVVVATSLIAVAIDLLRDLPEALDDAGTMDIDQLETFEHTLEETYRLEEGEAVMYPYDFYHALELPQESGEIVVCLIDHVSVTLTWTDEPDETRGPVSWENQPDSVSAGIYDSDHEVFERFDEATNPRGGEGSIVLSWQGDGEYLEESWRRVSEHEWEGVEGADYVELRNGDVHWDCYLDGELVLTEAGDQTHPRLPVGYSDTGNLVNAEITLGGRFVSLAPGSYEDPPGG